MYSVATTPTASSRREVRPPSVSGSSRLPIRTAKAAASRYGIRDRALVRLSAKSKASLEKLVATSTTWVSSEDISRAGTGTSAALARRRKRGMSSSLAATNSTSAAISVQAR
ncbi:hypothetical protein SVIOM342S_01800 [Streptomyces violaceorubidus]